MSPSVSVQLAIALVGIIIFAAFVRIVFADIGTSASFRNNQSINEFGGDSTSTSFSSVTTGGQIVSGESTSSSFALHAGFEYFDSFTPKSQNWRWYDDETNETPSLPLEDENVAPPSVFNNNIVKLRISVAETADIGQAGAKFKLQYATSTDFSYGVHDFTERTACTASSVWCYSDGSGTDNAVISTKVLSDADACSGGVGDGCGTHNESGTSTSSFTHKKSAVTEYEFTIESANATANTTYFFRLFDTVASSAVPLNTGETYPSLSSEGGTLTFSISGIPSSTLVAGVTTNVDTTSTGVPFGALPIGTPLAAAHKITISTNAAAGYRVFVFQQQGLLGDGGQEIPPVASTNETPSAWSSACLTSAAGCFGYHTGDDVLEGTDPVRFSVDDRYAKFSSAPEEVAYNGNPVTDEETNLVYRVIARDLQSAGEYSTNVVYIIVPTF